MTYAFIKIICTHANKCGCADYPALSCPYSVQQVAVLELDRKRKSMSIIVNEVGKEQNILLAKVGDPLNCHGFSWYSPMLKTEIPQFFCFFFVFLSLKRELRSLCYGVAAQYYFQEEIPSSSQKGYKNEQ